MWQQMSLKLQNLAHLLIFGKTARYGLGETTIPVLGDTLIYHLSGAFEEPITKEEWEVSPYYDPEIEWDESMTGTQARMTKKALDRDREFAELDAKCLNVFRTSNRRICFYRFY